MVIDDKVISTLKEEINYIKELLKMPSLGSNRDALRALAISFANLINRPIDDIESAYQAGRNAEEKEESTKAKNAVNHYPYGYVDPDKLERIKDAEFKFTDLLINACDDAINEKKRTKDIFDSIIDDPMAPGVPDKMRLMLEISKPENLEQERNATVEKVKDLRKQKIMLETRKQHQGGVLHDPKDQENLNRLNKKEREVIESSRLDLKSKLIVQVAKQVVQKEKGREIDHNSDSELREVALATKGVAKAVEKDNIDLDAEKYHKNYLNNSSIATLIKNFEHEAITALKKEKIQQLKHENPKAVTLPIANEAPSAPNIAIVSKKDSDAKKKGWFWPLTINGTKSYSKEFLSSDKMR